MIKYKNMEILSQMFDSPLILILVIIYFTTSSITTFDIRMMQAKKNGTLLPDEPMLPDWVKWIFWVDIFIFLSLLFLNWKLAIAIFILRFLLKVLPVLETIGNMLMAPFKQK